MEPSKTSGNGGGRCEKSIAFADISGFTSLSERMDPEKVTDLINRCFAILESIIIVHGGTVDKYLGDCVMAVFGMEGEPLEQAARNAVQAALEMREAMDDLNRRETLAEPLGLHVGVASGVVIACELGGHVKRDFTVLGDTVNLASRLEDASERGQVLVGERTYELTRREFGYRELSTVEVKESRQPVRVYELVGAFRAHRRAKRDSERRQASIVFADILGFKALREQKALEAVTELLNHCFTILEGVIRAHGGVVDKFVGECVMALFGVPNAIEDAPKQAINAAIEMRNALAQLNRETPLPTPLALHIGVNTGLVVAGEVGGPVRRSYTVMGDAANLAARLKEASPPGAIYVGSGTQRAVGDRFELRALPPLCLKGKAQPITAYELLSEREHVHRTKVESGRISSVMVGRAPELAQVKEKVLQVIEGQGGSIGILGEAGIGKSRLMAEVLALDALQDTLALEGRSLAIGENLSFHPFVDLLRQWTDIRDDESEAESFARLERSIHALAPEDMGEILPFVATLLGMRLTGARAERVAGIEGEALERLLIKTMRDLFQRLARAKPLMLIFEDLHWADQSSLKLLDALLRLVLDCSILFVFVSRPQFPETSDRILEAARVRLGPRHLDISLEALEEQQSAVLVQNLLRIENLPYKMRVEITRKTEGNPFFIEEVVHALIDAGAIEFADGRFRVTDKVESFVVPGTVQEVIMTRVDRLDPATRHLVQVASVIGRSFFYSVISEILRRQGTGDATYEKELAALKDRQLLIERKTGWNVFVGARTTIAELEYVFKHALAQQTIYESLLQRTRREFHLSVAHVIESIFADRLSDFYGMLAYHYGRAEDAEKAEVYLFKAGEEATRSAASSEALNFFQEASRLYFQLHGEGGDPEKKAALEKNVGLALLNTGRLTECIDHFDAALAYLGARLPRSDLGIQLKFAADLVSVVFYLYVRGGRSRGGRVAPSERTVFEIINSRARALTTSDPRRLFIDNIGSIRRVSRTNARQIDEACGIYVLASTMFAWSGMSFAIARRFAQAARSLCRPESIADVFVCRFLEFALDYLEGYWDRTQPIEDELVERALRGGRFWDVQTYLGLACDQWLRRGNFAAARECLDKLAEIRDVYGYEFAASNHDGMMAVLLLEERRLDSALQVASQYYTSRHEDTLRVLGLGVKAKIEILRGDRNAATVSLGAAREIVGKSSAIPPWHLSAYAVSRLLSDVESLERGLPDATRARRQALVGQARASGRYALEVASRVALPRTEVYGLLGRSYWLQGEPGKACKWWAKSVAEGERLGARPELARTYVEIGQRLADGSRQVAGLGAAEHLDKGRQLLGQLGLRWDLERLGSRERYVT